MLRHRLVSNSTKIFSKTTQNFLPTWLPTKKISRWSSKALIKYFQILSLRRTQKKGYEVVKIRQLGTVTRKMKIHIISLTCSPTNKTIFDETSLFYMFVNVKRYPSLNLVQCFKCHRFGHSSLNFGYALWCIKCIEQHLAKNCPKPLEITLKCTNCQGNPTTNYKKYPKLLKENNDRLIKRL